jgi:MurNAc alpha-1-phosphate uridylyltransferase
MKAMIFAAGIGSRLGELTKNIPKALVTISNKSVLEIAVEKLHKCGFNDIIVNVHHFAGKVIAETERLKNSGYRITVSDETDQLLDTGGGLYKARGFFDKNPFLLYNTDIVTDIDLKLMLACHNKNGGLSTLAVRNRTGNRFFLIDTDGRVRGWVNKATGEKILTGSETNILSEIAFSGIHMVNPAIFNVMEKGIYSLTALYLKIAAEHKIMTYRHEEGFWADIGTVENLEYVRRYYSGNR